jgi:hypothetical protein
MTLRHFLFAASVALVCGFFGFRAFGDFGQYPGAFGNFSTQGTNKLGVSGVAFHNMGVCTIASTTLSTTSTNETCTGVPASATVAVHCNGEAAFSTPTANGTYCYATGTANQVACNTNAANTTAMAYTCLWVQP